MSVARADDGTAPVLVVGAAGKTGRAVASALLARGVPVRAAVRAGREGAAPEGSVPVVVDLDTGEGLEAALAGCRAAYHLAPNVHPDEVPMARRTARAASAVGLPHLVVHSVLHPHDDRMPHHTRKAEAEDVLRAGAPGGVVVLRPAAYQENLLPAVLTGSVEVPYSPDTPFTNVALVDVAAAATEALLSPWRAGEVHDLAGPEVLTTREAAAVAASVLGRPVEVREVSQAVWTAGAGAGLDPRARDLLLAMFAAYDEDGLVGEPGPLAALLGRAPTRWAETVARAAPPGPVPA